ncbi:MAG: hypothetical protein N4A33_02880 [Bacteriovoracaceae bacterium]|jgi:cobalt-zinc-cadmium efflux system outer membrane protein|nr:hypothetical protein [Bacteriovoracaceae bacterium]
MYLYVFVALLFASNGVLASNATCNIRDIRDFYQQVKVRGPILSEAKKKIEEASSVIDVAKQRPNPELDFEYLKGDEFGLDTNTFTLSAKHVVEFGSKRGKRVEKAKSYKRLKKAEIDLALFNSNLHAIIGYQRVAQLNVTVEAVSEAIETFDKIVRKLSSRKRLNPEERVSLSTLRLASNDYKAQLNDLENEKTLLLGKLKFLSNCESIKPTYKYLDYQKIKLTNQSNEQSGLLKLEDFKVELAKSEVDVQKSLGYSDISIGPTFEYQGQGNDEFLSAGIAVSFAIPIFQTNDGGKIKAIKSLAAQKSVSLNQKSMLKVKRENLVSKFNRSLKTLSRMPKLKDLEKKHKKVDRLFARGVVSIPMTIESHRQQIDFIRSKFETENDVLSTYGEIILIDGNTLALEELF